MGPAKVICGAFYPPPAVLHDAPGSNSPDISSTNHGSAFKAVCVSCVDMISRYSYTKSVTMGPHRPQITRSPHPAFARSRCNYTCRKRGDTILSVDVALDVASHHISTCSIAASERLLFRSHRPASACFHWRYHVSHQGPDGSSPEAYGYGPVSCTTLGLACLVSAGWVCLGPGFPFVGYGCCLLAHGDTSFPFAHSTRTTIYSTSSDSVWDRPHR